MIINEDIHSSNLDITYHFEKSTCNSKYLVVVFSAFNPVNAKIKKSYHYIRTLSELNCNKLFILDSYGPMGCYYLGENMSFEVETSVVSLISKISTMYDIPNKNIITVGSSKGGSAALYFGMKYYYGHVISAVPQTKIAKFVLSGVSKKSTADYMLGTDESVRDSNVEKLNNIIYKQFQHNNFTEINLLSTEKDEQYQEHIAPLLELINSRSLKSNVVIDNDIIGHNDVTRFFPDFLNKKLMEITCGISFSLKSIKIDGELLKVDMDFSKLSNYDGTKISLLLEGGTNRYEFDLTEGTSDFTIDKADNYAIYVCFYKNTDTDKIVLNKYYKDKKLIGGKELIYNGNTVSYENKKIKFSHDVVDENNELKYAYYIYKDNVVIMRAWYGPDSSYEYEVTEPGKYKIDFFISLPSGQLIRGETETIIVDDIE